MRPFTYSTKFTLATVLLLPFIFALLWISGVPTTVSTSTYAAVAALLVGIGAVTLMTWRSAQPTDSMGQLLHATETEQTSKGARIE